jgi:uncharacterized protein involved in oxidation of intracellular sulfur
LARGAVDIRAGQEQLRSVATPTSPGGGTYRPDRGTSPGPPERLEQPVNVLMIINGPAYGADATYNAVRLAAALSKREDVTVRVFLMGDGVSVAMKNQKTPDGYYRLDRMISIVPRNGGQVLCCGTCMDARGIGEDLLIDNAHRSTMEDLATLTLAADKVLVF